MRQNSLGLGSIIHIRKAFYREPPLRDVHDRDARNFPDSSPKVFITGGHYVTTVLGHPIAETVVSVCPLMLAGKSLETGVLGDTEGHPILRAKLL
mmetsp:Transcript_12385/g.30489  ORF Transcript_12385/g.30489 Transcript_12385/m.30489 type:complete len:95 (+) Transcript_12385:149-433(+)